MLNSFSNIVLLTISALFLTACGNKAKGTALSEIENSDSIPVKVKQLIRAVADNDTASFAELVSYPLSRPYPLHDLNTKEELERYYPEIVDDSLKTALTSSRVSDWEDNGWKGWSLKNGKYLWLDDNLYDITYVSCRERIMLDSLIRKEMESLHPSLRDGWAPEGALRSVDGTTVCRIDLQKSEEKDPLYRLSLYKNGADLSGIPSEIFTGHRFAEGTAETYIYQFSDTTGRQAIFEPEMPDGSIPRIEFSSVEGGADTIPVERIYWLDHIKQGISKKK